MTHAVGIDLGSTEAVVAAASGDRNAELVPAGKKERTTPAYVSFDGRKVLLGSAARRQAGVNPAATFRLPPGLAADAGGGGFGPPPYELARHVASGLKAFTDKRLKSRPPHPAVVAVPTHADEAQSAVYRDAVQDAGFEVRRTLGAAQAVATAHGLDQEPRARILVVILGGLTLEVSVLDIVDGQANVIGGGTHPLGGDHWTQAIADHVGGAFWQAYGIDLRNDPPSWQRVFEGAEVAKVQLSTRDSAQINIPYIVNDRRDPKHIDTTVTRPQFEALTAHLVDQCVGHLAPALRQAAVAPALLDHVLLVGGGSQVPAVAYAVQAHLGRPVTPGPHPQEAVALGAALWAWSLR
ncbi:Hsp70 family protein [Yinghuangia sp. YIM S09857]|uniref:Hsp70 family protein n=1 Tax=Yinghuangia sp. YIM S09857 TaxID=3436929 RepID=UPI003F52CF19